MVVAEVVVMVVVVVVVVVVIVAAIEVYMVYLSFLYICVSVQLCVFACMYVCTRAWVTCRSELDWVARERWSSTVKSSKRGSCGWWMVDGGWGASLDGL